ECVLVEGEREVGPRILELPEEKRERAEHEAAQGKLEMGCAHSHASRYAAGAPLPPHRGKAALRPGTALTARAPVAGSVRVAETSRPDRVTTAPAGSPHPAVD